MKVAVVMGTRPEVIKLAPVVRELRSRGANVDVLVLEQHTDLLDAHLAEQKLHAASKHTVDRGAGSLAELTASLLTAAHRLLCLDTYDLVLVQGDTQTALAGALAAYYHDIPVGHVEAGLRTYQRNPFPEESNRQMISRLATYHFCPTVHNTENLEENEAVTREQVFITGNTSIDVLYEVLGDGARAATDRIRTSVLVTMHRREGRETYLPALLAVYPEIASRNPVQWFGHPGVPGVPAHPPVDHHTFVHRLKNAKCVITDSGGVIEEAVTLGIPTFILREETERGEALEHKFVKRLSVREVANLPKLIDEVTPGYPTTTFGYGNAASRIADIIMTL